MKKNLGKIMRVSTCILAVLCMTASSLAARNSRAQGILDKKISIVLKEERLKTALDKIARAAGTSFSYTDSHIPIEHKISIKVKDLPLKEVLDRLLASYPLSYTVFNERVILRYEPLQTSLGAIQIPLARRTAHLIPLRKVQPLTVRGRVTDETGSPLPGVSVMVKGSATGTNTDSEGNFELPNISRNAALEFSFIGYKKQEVRLSGQEEVHISMEPDIAGLDEVVVVGYGTQQKRDLTGAISSVEMDEELASRSMVEFGQALYGKVAGVQVINANGRPGSSSTVQVRGINSISAGSAPLLVVDGMPLSTYDLNLINSADIESIDILKDAASASIYGSRGANGVILVTTKRGRSGKPRINFSYASSLQRVIRKVDVMNSAEYAQAAIDAAQNGWVGRGGDPDAPNTIEARGQYKYTWPEELENPENLPDTDWQDQVFRTAPMQKIDLNVTGGSEKTTYLISGGYIDQTGIVITSKYKKYALNTNVTSEVTGWLEIGGGLNINYDHEHEPFNRIVEWAVQYPSIYPVYGSNGYLGAPANTPGFENYDNILFRPVNGHPFYRLNDDIQHKRFNNLGNVYAQVSFLAELSFKSAFNYHYRRVDNSNYQAIDHFLGPGNYTEGIMNVEQNNDINYTWQNLLNYNKRFNDHNVSAMLGFEYNKGRFHSVTSERRGYDNDLVPSLSMGRNIFEAIDDITESTLISWFGRVNYSYKNKYLLGASLRRDGSSRFGPENKWGYFPAVSAGWVISEEAFMQGQTTVSNLKLRGSYGYTGNDRIGNYRYLRRMEWERIAFGDNLDVSYYPDNIPNPDLAWERTQQVNLGMEASLFNERIYLEADFYRSTSDGLLLNVPVPSLTGFTGMFQNIGKLENRGVELNLNAHILTGELTWSAQLNFARNRNEILELGRDDAPMIINFGNNLSLINKVGEPINSIYAYQYAGVYKNQAEIDADPASYSGATPGDGRYTDVNQDGVLTGDDRTIIGNNAPDFTYGITNNFRYKGFDLSFLIQGTQGNEVYDNNIRRSKFYHEGRNYFADVTGRWRSEEEPGDDHHYKLNVDLGPFNHAPSSYMMVDGSYLRVKSLTLGYNFPAVIVKKLRLETLRIYFNGQNLFTLQENPLFDSENFSGDITNDSRRAFSHSPYPSAKMYTLGVNIGL